MEKVKLSDICTPKQWKTIPTSELLNEGYPVYGANGIIGYYDEYNHEKPVVTITCRGATCGSINVTVPRAYVTGNAMCLDDIRDDIELEYLYYCLLHYDFGNIISGSAQPQITRQGLEKVYLNIGTYEEQIEIVKRLKRIERVIELREKELKSLDDLIKARFVELFGNPVKNDREWESKTLNDICDGIGDGLHGTPVYDEDGEYPFINGNNLINGEIVITPATKMVSEETYQKHFIEISPNAILISINGTLGKLAFYNGEKVMLGKSACYCNLKQNVNKVFVYGVMKSDSFAEFLDNSSTKSTIKNVGLKAIREYKLILPPTELQEQFATFVEQTDKSKSANPLIFLLININSVFYWQNNH